MWEKIQKEMWTRWEALLYCGGTHQSGPGQRRISQLALVRTVLIDRFDHQAHLPNDQNPWPPLSVHHELLTASNTLTSILWELDMTWYDSRSSRGRVSIDNGETAKERREESSRGCGVAVWCWNSAGSEQELLTAFPNQIRRFQYGPKLPKTDTNPDPAIFNNPTTLTNSEISSCTITTKMIVLTIQ